MLLEQLRKALRSEDFPKPIGFFYILHFFSSFWLISLNFQSFPISPTPLSKFSHLNPSGSNIMLDFLAKEVKFYDANY
jgi:hypothetical protein